MIAEFVTLISLNMSLSLLQDYGVIAGTLPITNATVTTPIRVTSTAHGWAKERRIHGVVSGVVGTTEANGLWILTPIDANTFELTKLDAQGNVVNSVGANAYISGGQIQWAFPDGRIMLGRRNKALATSVTSPRVVFIPTTGRPWDFEAFGGAGPDLQPAAVPPVRGSAQQQTMKLQPQLATQHTTFEVYVNGSGPNFGDPLEPDYADFNATQALVHILYAQLFDAVGGVPRAKILREDWPSQKETQGAQTQRGQQWMGVLEIQQPVLKPPKQFAPIGVHATMLVQPVNPGPTDPQEIDIT